MEDDSFEHSFWPRTQRQQLQKQVVIQRICFKTWKEQVHAQCECECDFSKSIIMETAAEWVDVQTAVLMQSFSLAWRSSLEDTQMVMQVSLMLLVWRNEVRIGSREREAMFLCRLRWSCELAQAVLLHWRYHARMANHIRESEHLRRQLQEQVTSCELETRACNVTPSLTSQDDSLRISRRCFETLLDRLREDVFGGAFVAWRQVVNAVGKESIQNNHRAKDQCKKKQSFDKLSKFVNSSMLHCSMVSCSLFLRVWYEQILTKRKEMSLQSALRPSRQNGCDAPRWKHATDMLLTRVRGTLLHVIVMMWSSAVREAGKQNILAKLQQVGRAHQRSTCALLNTWSIHTSHRQEITLQMMMWSWRVTSASSRRAHTEECATQYHSMTKLGVMEGHRHALIVRKVFSSWNRESRVRHVERNVCKINTIRIASMHQRFQTLLLVSVRQRTKLETRCAFFGWRRSFMAIHRAKQLQQSRERTRSRMEGIMLRSLSSVKQEVFFAWSRAKNDEVVTHLKEVVAGMWDATRTLKEKARHRASHLIEALHQMLLQEMFLLWLRAISDEKTKLLQAKVRHDAIALIHRQSALHQGIVLERFFHSWHMWMDWRSEFKQLGRRHRTARTGMAAEWSTRQLHARLSFLFAAWRGQMLNSHVVVTCRETEANLRATFKRHASEVAEKFVMRNCRSTIYVSFTHWCQWVLQANFEQSRQTARIDTQRRFERVVVRSVEIFSDNFARAFFLLWTVALSWQRNSHCEALQCQQLELLHTHLKQKVQDVRFIFAWRHYVAYTISALQSVLIAWQIWASRELSQRRMEERGYVFFLSLQQAISMFADCCRDAKLYKMLLQWKELVSVARGIHDMQQQVEHIRHQNEKDKQRLTKHFSNSLDDDFLQLIVLSWRNTISWGQRFSCLEGNMQSSVKQCEDLKRQNVALNRFADHILINASSVECARLVECVFQLWRMEAVRSNRNAEKKILVQQISEALQKSMVVKSSHRDTMALYDVMRSWYHCAQSRRMALLDDVICGTRENIQAVRDRAASVCYGTHLHSWIEIVFLMWLMLLLDAHLRQQMDQRREKSVLLSQWIVLALENSHSQTKLRVLWMQWKQFVSRAQRLHGTTQLQDVRSQQVHLLSQMTSIVRRSVFISMFAILRIAVYAWHCQIDKRHFQQEMRTHATWRRLILALKRAVLKSWRSMLDDAKSAFDIKMQKTRISIVAFSLVELVSRLWHNSTMEAILRCMVTVWKTEVSQRVYQIMATHSGLVVERCHGISCMIAARLETYRTSVMVQVIFTVWHDSVVEQAWANDSIQFQQQFLQDKSHYKELAVSMLARSDQQHSLANLQHVLVMWKLHAMQIGFDDEAAFLKARWHENASATVGKLLVERASSCKLMVLWAWKSYVANEMDRMLAEDAWVAKRESRAASMNARAAATSHCFFVALAAFLHWERVTKYSRVKALSAAIHAISDSKLSMMDFSGKRETRTLLRCVIFVWSWYLHQLKYTLDENIAMWALWSKRREKALLGRALFFWAFGVNRRTQDNWQQTAARVARRLATSELVVVARGSMLIWWLVAHGGVSAYRMKSSLLVRLQEDLEQQCCHMSSSHAASLLDSRNPQSNLRQRQLQQLMQTEARLVGTINGGLENAAFTEWRIVTLSQKQTTQALLLRRGAKVVSRALDWRKTKEMVSLGDAALEAWRRHCMQSRCDRQMHLLAEEKEAMQRELSYFRNGRERCKRNALAIIEQSMSAASLLQSLESDQSQMALPDSTSNLE